ncbi:MAG: hypothetical protein WC358_00950, partial [Ignavibacteria bacterium]
RHGGLLAGTVHIKLQPLRVYTLSGFLFGGYSSGYMKWLVFVSRRKGAFIFLSKRKNGVYYIWYKDELTGIMKKDSTKAKIQTQAQQYLFNFEKIKREQDKSKFFTLTSLRDFALNYVQSNLTKSTLTANISRRISLM